MPHLILSFYLLALIAGTAALSQTLLLWRRYRKLVIRRYAWFLLALLLILLGFVVDLYARVAGLSGVAEARIVVWILQAAGGLTYIFTCPFFFHSLAGLQVRGVKRGAFFGIDAAAVLAAAANVAFPAYLPVVYALSGILFAMIAYGILFVAVHLRGIGEKPLRRAIGIFLGLSAVFFPLMLIDVVMELVPYNLAQPLYFLVLNCLTIASGKGDHRYAPAGCRDEAGRGQALHIAEDGGKPRLQHLPEARSTEPGADVPAHQDERDRVAGYFSSAPAAALSAF